MARIAESELERLKAEVSLVRLIEAAGHTLKRQGKDLAMRCPFHDGDDTPSFIVTPAKNVWHCFGCQAGGTAIDWVMRTRAVSFRHAVELLARESPALAAPTRAVRSVAPAYAPSADESALLGQVIEDYHAGLKASPEAQAYLAKRGLDHPELIDTFKLGYANRTLGYRLPEKNRLPGAALRGALQRLGILRASGHEHFAGSLVVPVFGEAGAVVEVYGRKIASVHHLRPGTALHLYLPGPHRGVFNLAGIRGADEVILTEALLDALTFWCAGYRNVTSAYGVSGFTDEILAALVANRVERVLIAYDRDDAGDAAAAKLAPVLEQHGIAPYRVLFPKGMDANAYALKVGPAAQSLGLVLRRAEFMGQGPVPRPVATGSVAGTTEARPEPGGRAVREAVPVAAPDPEVPSLVASSSVAAAASTAATSSPPPEPASPAPSLPVEVSAQLREREVMITFGSRRYRVRGLDKNLAYEVLKVNVLVAGTEAALHVDTFDLYQAKARAAFAKPAALELGVDESVILRDLGQVLLKLEALQDAAIQAATQPKPPAPGDALSPAQQDAALALLRDPTLIERIVADFERAGLVGEPVNALVGYLAAVTRKLKHPLALLVQSTSAAGKSTLMDAVLRFVPEADRVHYSAMTGQSLFYLGEQSMQHRILAIAEEEGVRQAAYALKVLQSQGSLTIASTGKDPATGDLQTKTYTVEGPVMLFLTTTAIDVDEELTNRCLVLTIDESREQTRAILHRQRQARTLAGLRADREAEGITATHRAAQQLLRPLAVVNPYADRLGFLDDRTRLRRDHQKYLTLIDAIAFLHQHQRPIRRCVEGGETIEYVEVVPADIALANRLAHEVLGRSLDELPPQTRRLLGAIDALVRERIEVEALARSAVRFTRRELRARVGISDTQLGIHLERLVRLEYVVAHAGRRGQSFVYELLFDGDAASDTPHLPGLIEVAALGDDGTASKVTGSEGEFAGSSRPQNGAITGPLRAAKISATPRADADLLPLAAASPQTARPAPSREKPPYRRRGNGAAAAR